MESITSRNLLIIMQKICMFTLLFRFYLNEFSHIKYRTDGITGCFLAINRNLSENDLDFVMLEASRFHGILPVVCGVSFPKQWSRRLELIFCPKYSQFLPFWAEDVMIFRRTFNKYLHCSSGFYHTITWKFNKL